MTLLNNEMTLSIPALLKENNWIQFTPLFIDSIDEVLLFLPTHFHCCFSVNVPICGNKKAHPNTTSIAVKALLLLGRDWTTSCVAGSPSLPYYWITLPWPTDMTNVLWLCRRAVALPCDAAAHQLHHQPMAENRKNRVWNSVRCQWWICFSTISIFLFFSLLFLFHYTLVMRARVLSLVPSVLSLVCWSCYDRLVQLTLLRWASRRPSPVRVAVLCATCVTCLFC